uniref:Uncharacterized protein n=1 Tax=Triticum urartu TaxID=4572 RepID=A0A8R7PST4_TRIUA
MRTPLLSRTRTTTTTMTMAFTTVPMIPSKEQTGLGLALSGENGPKAWSYIVRLIISNSSAKVLIHRLFAQVFKI